MFGRNYNMLGCQDKYFANVFLFQSNKKDFKCIFFIKLIITSHHLDILI